MKQFCADLSLGSNEIHGAGAYDVHMAVKTTCSYPNCDLPRASGSSNYCRKHWALYARLRRTNEKTGAIRQGLDIGIDFFERIAEANISGHRAAELLRILREDHLPRERIFTFRDQRIKGGSAGPGSATP